MAVHNLNQLKQYQFQPRDYSKRAVFTFKQAMENRNWMVLVV